MQRVRRASVEVDSEVVGSIGPGVLVLLGVARGDGRRDEAWLRRKILNLRIFEDERGKMNRSLLETGGAVLLVSQFTLYGDCRKGNRPSFSHAAPPALAEELYLEMLNNLKAEGVPVAAGRFGAMMQVSLLNDGPVTLILDSPVARP